MSILEKSLLVTAVVAIIILAFLIVYGEKAYIEGSRLRLREQILTQTNLKLEKENMALEKKIERLKKDIRYIEHLARHELGMVAENELVFRFRENN